MPEVPRYYWDANVFLSYVDGTPERLPHIDALLSQARRGEIEIVTSVASITEVAFGSVEMDERALSPEIQQQINGLWAPNSPVKLAEVSILMVEGARELMRQAIPEGRKVPKPMDAIHLSTAQRLRVAAFHTYDDPLLKIARRIGLTANTPIAESPHLPMEYGESAVSEGS